MTTQAHSQAGNQVLITLWRACLALLTALAMVALATAPTTGCVTERIYPPAGPGSFKIDILEVSSFEKGSGCADDTTNRGTRSCPRPWVTASNAATATIRATVLDRYGVPINDWNGTAVVDVRPGWRTDQGLDQTGLQFQNGVAQTTLSFAYGTGPVRIWVEHCSTTNTELQPPATDPSSTADANTNNNGDAEADRDVTDGEPIPTPPTGEPGENEAGENDTDTQTNTQPDGQAPTPTTHRSGTLATGVSAPIWFDSPTLTQINATTDNGTSPLIPTANNVCSLTAEPRYAIAPGNERAAAKFVGWDPSAGMATTPPPAIGHWTTIRGCSRAAHEQAQAAGAACDRGPLVVTAIAPAGFYLSDFHPDAIAAGFNHIYVFNFNAPDDLEVGDVLTELKGSPVEFTGTTQLVNPTWNRDPSWDDPRTGLRRPPITIPANPITVETMRSSLRSYGRNSSSALELEKLEGGVVCLDNLAPASNLTTCDKNSSGGVERLGCRLSFRAKLPPRCEENRVQAIPSPPSCTPESAGPYCLPLTAAELKACGLRGYAPSHPEEYCCERICANDPTCLESGAYTIYGQWSANMGGGYDRASTRGNPIKVNIISRDAVPDFDPIAFAKEQLQKPAEQRQTLRVMGNLRHVLAARPVWLVEVRQPSDIAIGGTCASTNAAATNANNNP